MLEGSGNDASLAGGIWQSLHGEGLPTACLAIGKNGTIVALSDTLCERKPKRRVQLMDPGVHHGAQPTDPAWVSTKQGTILPSNNSLMGLNIVPRWGGGDLGTCAREPTWFKSHLHVILFLHILL